MYSKTAIIQNPTGLHARPAADFVQCASRFDAQVRIARVGDEPVNAKSMILLLSRGLSRGTEVEISAEGPDEVEAVEALISLLASGLGE